MTPQEFRDARARLDLSVGQLASILNVEVRTIRKWESLGGTNARDPNPVAARAMEWMLGGFRPPEWNVTPSTSDQEG